MPGRAPAGGALAWNLRSLAHLDPGAAFGDGIALQTRADGRRILWLPDGAAPAQVFGVDVTEPARPRLLVTLPLGSAGRCTGASVAGDRLALAIGDDAPGTAGVGIVLCDVTDPAAPRLLGRLDASAPHSRGAAHVWFGDEQTLHVACAAADLVPRDARDDALYQCLDVDDPARPRVAGRWWQPGTMVGDDEPSPTRVDARFDTGARLHAARAWPARPDRVWLAYGDAGVTVLDLADRSRPRPAIRWAHSPPYHGATHAAVPLGASGHALVADATVVDGGADAPKSVWVVDFRADSPERAATAGPGVRRALAIASLPPPPHATFAARGGRFGATALHANPPGRGHFVSATLAVSAFGNGGVRVHDVSDPYAPVEAGWYVPQAAGDRPSELHDVLADDRGLVFAVGRRAGGLHVLALEL